MLKIFIENSNLKLVYPLFNVIETSTNVICSFNLFQYIGQRRVNVLQFEEYDASKTKVICNLQAYDTN